MKLICFGDSLTEGVYGGSYVDALRRRHPQHPIVNAGVGGSTVINLLRRVDAVIAEAPDAVFVMIGGNDAISYTFPGTRSYYRKVHAIPDGMVTPDQFAQAYRELLERLHLAHVLTYIGLPPTEYNPQTVAAFRQYNALAAEAARAVGAPALDLLSIMMPPHIPDRPPLDIDTILTIGTRVRRGWRDYERARIAGGFTFTFDGLHLTPEAADTLADHIGRFIGLSLDG